MFRSLHPILPLFLAATFLQFAPGCAQAQPDAKSEAAPAADAGSSTTPTPNVNAPHSDIGHVTWEFLQDEKSPFSKRSDEAQARGDYAEVAKINREWQTQSPRSCVAVFNQGSALFYLGRFEEAIAAWNQGAKLQPELEYAAQQRSKRAQVLQTRFPNRVLPPVAWVSGDAYKGRFAITKQTRALVNAKKWDEIEKLNQSLLQSRKELSDGSWELTWFFGSLWGVPDKEETELAWRKRRDTLQAWSKARPKSLLAKLVVGRCWADGAWLARGTKFASETAPESMERMEQRLVSARSYFLESRALLTKNPMWAGAFQQFSQLAGMDDETYNTMFAVATKSFPTYSNLSLLKSVRLAPRWYGEPGDWEKFATAQADATARTRGATAGDILYAHIIWGQQRQFSYTNIWQETDASWPRTKRGLLALMKRYPNSLSVASITCKLAVAAREFEFAEQLLNSNIKGQVESLTWRDLDEFFQARIKILERGRKPVDGWPEPGGARY